MKKSLKRILCAMLVLVFIFANANVAFAAELKYPEVKLSYPKLYNSTAIDILDFENCIDVAKFNAYMVEQLKLDDCVNGSDYVHVDVSEFKIPSSMSNSISEFIWYNSPELFNISGMNYTLNSTREYISSIYFATYYTKEEYAKMHSKMVEHAEILLYDVKGNDSLSDVEKALILHDRLAAFNEYDYESYRNNTIPQSSYNAYGALVLGTSVCMGYALAYDYLLEQVGIKSEYCSSDVLFHAWNIVYIDNKPYHVDVTWDDPVWDVTGRVNHGNFLRSTQGIIETGHIGDDGTVDFITTPVDTTYDNYFWQDSEASFEAIGDKIYYIDGADMKLYEVDDINDAVTKASLTTISDFSNFKWCYSNGSYYGGSYSKLGSSYGLLYYSMPDGISCYNPVTQEAEMVLTLEELEETYPGRTSDYDVTGMNVFACIVSGEYYNDPWYDSADVKKENYFIVTLHEEASEWTIVTPATTTTKGKKVLKCTKCNENIKTEEIPVVSEHTCNWSDWETVVRATCSTEGKQISKCSICYEEKTQTLKKLEHNFTEHTIQATCNATGLKYKECSVCKTKVTLETIPATNEHKASDTWVTSKAATCAEAGYEILPCVNCGLEMDRKTIAQLPHGETELANKKDATCSQEGYTGDTRCKNCKTVITYGTKIAKTNHNPSDWKIRTVATFTKDGLKYKECTVCGIELETAVIPKLIHKFDDGKITKQPTCTEDGIKTYTCTKCGETKEEIIYAKGHSEVVIPAVASTCTVGGSTEGKKCSVCSEVLVEPTALPKAEHKTTLVGHKDATFEEDGFTGSEVCTVCNQTINPGSVIPKLEATLKTPTVTGTVTNAGIQVSWNTVENAQSYDIYRRQYNASTKKWSGWSKIQTGYTETNYVDGAVVLGTNYRYTVRAVNGTVMSGYTSSATIKYNVTPTVKVANASNGIKVTWSTAANATGYTVYRSTYSNGKWSGWKNMGTAKANKTAWVDKNVKTGVAYKYTVRAAYGKILSSYNKSGASVVFLNTPAVKIANNATGMKVAWSKVAGGTGYVIYSSQYDPATNSWSKWSNRGAVNTNSWIDTAVQSGVTYKYTVRALNGKSLSAYVSSGALMYLAQPTVTIANASKGINVSWSQSAGATGYTVYRSEYDAKTKKWSSWKNRGTATVDKSSWVDKKVTSGKYYKYTVRAINGNAKSTFVSTGGMIFLAQPTITVSKDTNSNVISWNAVSGATGYRVFRKANGETNWSIVATVKNTSCSDTNVNDESTYTYTVRAYKGKVWSSYDKNGVTINRNYKQAVFDLVNIERAKAGLSPLEYYTDGQLAGDIRANEIAKKFAHERPDGNSCFTVFKEIGVSYGYAGENIARGQRTPEIVVNDWMNSPGHRGNILDPNYTYLIVGYDAKTNSWVQLFFSPYIDNIPDEIE